MLATLASLAPCQSPTEFRFAREGVLGTSSDLVLRAADAAAAERAADAVFGEVARLETVLSHWRPDSELSRLVAAGGGTPSADLRQALELGTTWRERSAGAFEPGVARLATLWATAETAGQPPAAADLAAAAKALHEPAYTLAAQVVVKAPFTLDGVAKGWIVDRAAQRLPAGTTLVSFQIGGDTMVGKPGADIAVVDPRHPASNATPLLQLHLVDRAVASSGGYERGYRFGERHHSHILDPRTGQPCDDVLGASVVAKDVATADAVATTLCVLGAEAGLRWLAGIPDTAAVLVTKDGTVHRSPGLAEFVAPDAPTPPVAGANGWPAGFALTVDFTIKGQAAGTTGRRGGWKRPYVAVWVEDLTEAPARTLCLWVENPRWLRDLRRWSRQYADQPRVFDTISQATRKAGHYTLTWDGTDDEGRALAPGRYTVVIEVAREHGTYQLMRKPIDLGTAATTIEFEANEEIEQAKAVFGKPGQQGH